MIYDHNDEIVTFFGKAQFKIAQLGEQIASNPSDDIAIRLSLDLLNFLESLDSPYMDWEESKILRYIQYYTKRAKLSEVPYLYFPGYTSVLVTGGDTNGLDLDAINALLKNLLHNNLKGIQPERGYVGEVVGEKYHISKAMYDWIIANMIHFTPPTLSLSLATLPLTTSGVYEKGTAINITTLTGSVNLNDGKKVTAYSYLRNGDLLGTVVVDGILPVKVYTDRNEVRSDSVFKFTATFQEGGTLSDSKSVTFVIPFFSGIYAFGASNAQVQTLKKELFTKPSKKSLTFNVPAGNTTANIKLAPQVLFDASYGLPKSCMVGVFDFKNDWTFTTTTMLLADGTTVPAIRGQYNTEIEGSTTFDFNW